MTMPADLSMLDRPLRLAVLSALLLPLLSGSGSAQTARQSMERCVGRVLSRLADTRARPSEVGPAVIARCDAELRATLAAAIRSGEAAGCSVESCLSIARDRASEEATSEYRSRVIRRETGR